jgi:hypothetical protein
MKIIKNLKIELGNKPSFRIENTFFFLFFDLVEKIDFNIAEV